MNRQMTAPRWLTLLGALLVLGALNFSIVGKERIKSDGEIVYLRLAPVDPRSLMQGDYMALRFALVQELDQAVAGGAREGEVRLAPVALGPDRVAVLADATVPATLKLRYRIRNGQVWLGTNAFFFRKATPSVSAPHATVSFASTARVAKRCWWVCATQGSSPCSHVVSQAASRARIVSITAL